MSKYVHDIWIFLFFGLLARILVLGATLPESLCVISLAALLGLDRYLKSKAEPPVNDAIRQEVEILKSTLNALKIERTLRR